MSFFHSFVYRLLTLEQLKIQAENRAGCFKISRGHPAQAEQTPIIV